jgi:glucosylceramidase
MLTASITTVVLTVALFCAVTTAASPPLTTSTISVIESGSSGATWSPRTAQVWLQGEGPSNNIIFDRTALRQSIEGFGACFTDTSAYNALVFMNDSIRSQFIESFWGQSGLQASLMRMHLNSPDYSVHSYNEDNVTDDFSLTYFDHNLTYDEQRLLPLARLAIAKTASWTSDPLHVFASPWSPPGWMKNNNDMINSDKQCLKNDTKSGHSYRDAWARYIATWIVDVDKHGIPIWGLTPQNEVEARQRIFESCAYSVDDYVNFVGTYLGPALQAANLSTHVLGYDHNKLDSYKYAEGIEMDTKARQVVDYYAIHWYDYYNSLGLDILDSIHLLAPSKPIINTEACYLDSLTYDWNNTGFLYAVDIIGDLTHWVSGWVNWNTVLLAGDRFPESFGGPNHDNTTHFGDGILFEFNASGTQRLIFQSSYWVHGHFSRFMRPGSVVVVTTGDTTATAYSDFESIRNHSVVCAKTPCGHITEPFKLLSVGYVDKERGHAGVIVANANAVTVSFNINDAMANRYTVCSIPPFSIQTYDFGV